MKFIEKISTSVARMGSSIATQYHYHEPRILFVAGSALIGAGVVCAFKAGAKIARTERVANFKRDLEVIDTHTTADLEASYIPAKEARKNRAKQKVKATANFVKEVGKDIFPPIALTAGGLALQTKGFMKMEHRYMTAAAGLTAALAVNQDLQTRIENADADAYDQLQTNGHYESVVRNVVDDNGDTTVQHDVILVSQLGQLQGPDFIYSRETVVKGGFIEDEAYVRDELIPGAIHYCNRKLQDIDGYVFGEEVVKCFGVEPRAIDRTVGCCKPDPKYPLPGDEMRVGAIDISYKKIFIEYEDGSRSNAYLIKPKYDAGSILDIYQNYSLNKFRVR